MKDRALYDDANILYEKSLAIRKQQLGAEHPLTCQATAGLADTLCAMGKGEKDTDDTDNCYDNYSGFDIYIYIYVAYTVHMKICIVLFRSFKNMYSILFHNTFDSDLFRGPVTCCCTRQVNMLRLLTQCSQ